MDSVSRTTTERQHLKFWRIIARSIEIVHCCGSGDSMRACHATGPGSIPGRDKFSGWTFFRGFSSPVRQMSGSFSPIRSSNIISYHYHPFIFTLFEWMSAWMVVYRLSCWCCIGGCPDIELSPIRGGPPYPCVVKKVWMWSKDNSFFRQVVAL